jgi:phenylalanyl-tRNA synthetase beta chain
MNLALPHSWLKEFLTTSASAKKIADCLSLAGPSVEYLEKLSQDFLYHLEITTNRVDMMSVQGIAREAAAILPQFSLTAKLRQDIYKNSFSLNTSLPAFPLQVSISDPKLCPRFSAVVISQVQVKASPEKIKNFLEKSGIRSLNNVVDISNYLMRAYGQPIHTFDLDKIKDKLQLRLSKKGETITTLDNKNHVLPGQDIIIEDKEKIIDLCGVMGGLNSAIDQNTKNVILFVQTYSPWHIRRTSMTLSQRTEAAQIFEKQTDPELVMPVLNQGIQLFKQLAGGKQTSQVIDLYPKPYKPRNITFPLHLIKSRLGVEIPEPKVKKILTSLGFKTEIKQRQLRTQVPSWRCFDVSLPEDIIEELARVYGYQRLPSYLMTGSIPLSRPSPLFEWESKLKYLLKAFGLNELYTYSLVSQVLALQSGYKLNQHLKIKNPLSEEWQFLRRSLIPSHLQVISQNSQQKSLSLFEIAHVYQPLPRKLPLEERQLIISTTKNYASLKGTIETLAQAGHLSVEFKPEKNPPPGLLKNQSASLTSHSVCLGHLGKVKLPPGFPFSQVSTAIIKLQPFIKQAKTYPKLQPLPPYPPVIEDLTFTLPQKTYLGQVISRIKKLSPLIHQVSLTKSFHNNYTFKLVYLHPSQPLTDKQIQPLRRKIAQTLSRQFKAKLVGKLN